MIIVPDQVRGHIGIVAATGEPVGSFTDTGDQQLHLWMHRAADFDPAHARALGEALVAWADRREAER